jgi:D-amino peptidase
MEGISGLVHWEETGRKGAGDYERARRLMTQDANAAALGAFDGGASEVTINDSHGGMRNILVEDLDERVRLISGSPKFLSMVEGVGACDVAMFVGYHSRALSLGVMNHTYTGAVVEYRINGLVLGECGMNAYVAGQYGVPVIMVSGDREAAAEAAGLIPGVRTVAVKEPVTALAANLLHPARARALLREAAAAAVREARGSRPAPLKAAPPVRLELRLVRSEQADAASVMPGSERLDPVTVAWSGDDYLQCYRAFRAMIALAARD